MTKKWCFFTKIAPKIFRKHLERIPFGRFSLLMSSCDYAWFQRSLGGASRMRNGFSVIQVVEKVISLEISSLFLEFSANFPEVFFNFSCENCKVQNLRNPTSIISTSGSQNRQLHAFEEANRKAEIPVWTRQLAAPNCLIPDLIKKWFWIDSPCLRLRL